MRIHFLLSLSLLLSNYLFGQKFDSRIAPTKQPLSEIELILMPSVDNEALRTAELERRGPGVAPRFAEAMEVDIQPNTHGQWEALPNGKLVWRLRLLSKDAYSLNLGFTKFIMPEGGTLILYSPNRKDVMGPFTPADNEVHEQLWTPVFNSEEIVIEVSLPKEKQSELKLQLKTVNHDFMGFGQALSGSCNVDVVCGAADGFGIVDRYRDIIQSVAVYSREGIFACTGFLISSARKDCAPLFMTANHCGIRQENAVSMVTYWNFQNSICRQPNSPESEGVGDGTLLDFNTGATFRAGYGPSDFTLVELDDPVSETANAFFVGWDRDPNPPTDSVICVHHPSTNEKRISFDFDATQINTFSGINSIQVEDWDIGTTEGGSSGSPLFNNRKQVVGQLFGGGAACGNNASDFYGRLSVSWEGGGTPNTRLKDWLDPDETGITAIDGEWQTRCGFNVQVTPTPLTICAPNNAVYTLLVSENFTADVALSLEGLPIGLISDFSVNPASPGATVTLTISNTGVIASGTYNFTLNATDGVESSSTTIRLTTFITAPDVPILVNPMDASDGTSLLLILDWNDVDGASDYEVELATDVNFTNIISFGTNLPETQFETPLLTAETEYFWRVRGNNICGLSDWSQVFSFVTGAISCSNSAAAGLPLVLVESGVNSITSTIDVNLTGTIVSVQVNNLNITHTYIGDLSASLMSPRGTTIELFNRPGVPADLFGCDGANLALNFSDFGAESAATLERTCGGGIPSIDGTFNPINAFSDLNGEIANGTWTLTITDNAENDGGQLDGWELLVCTVTPNEATLISSQEMLEKCENEAISFDILVGAGFDAVGTTLTASGLPDGAVVGFSENPAVPGSNVTVTVTNLSEAGEYSIMIEGTDGSNTASTTVDLNLLPLAGPVSLRTPMDNATDMPANVLLSWNASLEADEYMLVVATDASFNNIFTSLNLSGTLFNLTGLDMGVDYFWKVIPINNCGPNEDAVVRKFTTLLDLAFGINPASVQVCQTDSPVFEISVGASFASPSMVSLESTPDANFDVNYSVDPSNVQPASTLTATFTNLFNNTPGNYTLRFEINDGQNTNEVEVQFDLLGLPNIPVLNSPSNGAIFMEQSPTFSWEAIAGTTEYLIEIARDDAFTDIITSERVSENTYAVSTMLEGGLFFWRITAFNNCGGATSAPFGFTVQTTGVHEVRGRRLTISPNPTANLLNIEVSEPFEKDTQFEIFTLNGQILQRQAMGRLEQNTILDLSNYASGVYLLRIVNGTSTIIERIVLQK